MRKVLVLAQVIRPGGGPGGYVCNLERGIQNLPEFETADLHFRFEGARDGRSSPNHSGQRFKHLTTIRNALEVTGLRSVLLKARFHFSQAFKFLREAVDASDVVVIHGPFFLDILRYANKKKKLTIYMPHSPVIYADEYRDTLLNNGLKLPRASYNIRYKYERDCITEASFVVFPSPGASKEYVDKFSLKDTGKVHYLASGVTVDFQPSPDATDPDLDIPTVLYAGRYVDHKGFADFCQAAETAASRRLQAKFVSAGAGPLKASKNVHDLGWRSDIHALVQGAQLVAIPNRVAYYDLLPLECAALGKPMVMSAVGGSIDQAALLPDTVAYSPEGEDALLVAVETALRRLAADPDWGKENASRYKLTFTSEEMARRWVSLVRAI
nr:glycosyltransferase [uncultured Devosia sp.]